MPRVLYVTTELPYFPGQGGLMSLLVRHLAETGTVGVIGPRYNHQPAEAVEHLRAQVTATHFWPNPVHPGEIPAEPERSLRTRRWLTRLPRAWQRRILERTTGLHRHSPESLAWLAVFNHLAPYLLEALSTRPWQIVLLAQSTSAVWTRYLPATVATCVYFHDVRSDYLARFEPGAAVSGGNRRRRLEERRLVRTVDAAAFVSDLDHERARRLLAPRCATAVVPVCVDPRYFAYAPPEPAQPPVVLFTGHLSHPPNVDAARYFLSEIWPLVRLARPDAVCHIAGLQPAEELRAAVAAAPAAHLHPDVADMRTEFAGARVFVIPMRFGGGVRQKILEAWACGVPVVTTAMGAEGLPATDGENCSIRDDPAAFAAEVVRLLAGPVPAEILARARATVEVQHTPADSGARMQRLLAAAVGRRRQGPAKVLFDLRWMEIGRSGGLEQMTHELIAALAAVDRQNEYRFSGPRRTLLEWDFPHEFRHRLHFTDGLRRHWTALRDTVTDALADNLNLPALSSPALRALESYSRLDFTIVHALPCYTHPDLLRFPSVVTVHDLQHLHLPEFFTPADIATRERHYRESCHAATHLICVSEFTRQDVHLRYGVPLARMSTIWNIPPRCAALPMGERRRRGLLRGMGIAGPFLLYPAHGWLHKNHHRLLTAFATARAQLPRGLTLVLTGGSFIADHPAGPLLAELSAQGWVRHLGFRTPLEMAALYRSAEAVVFPSLFEGFGMPVVEAMYSDCPVACSGTTSLPEIAGDAARFFDPAKEESIADALVQIANDGDLRDRLRAAGRRRLDLFNPATTARRTIEVYRQVHEEHFS